MISLGKMLRGWMFARSRSMRKTWSGKLPGLDDLVGDCVSPLALGVSRRVSPGCLLVCSWATVPVTETGLWRGIALRSWFTTWAGLSGSWKLEVIWTAGPLSIWMSAKASFDDFIRFLERKPWTVTVCPSLKSSALDGFGNASR